MLVSRLIYPIYQHGQIGKIHSVFAQSYNIQIKDYLLHIGSYREYISSFGSYVESHRYFAMKPYLQVGNIVKLGENQITIYSTAGVETFEIEMDVIDLKVEPVPVEIVMVDKLRQALQAEKLETKIGLTIGAEEREVFNQLETPRLSSKDIDQAARFLIGRGKGLTPSGDDIIVAYLFVMLLFDQERFMELSLILNNYLDTTTDVSKEYIRSCIKGYVSSPIHHLYMSIKEQAAQTQLSKDIQHIMNIGHTSGRDMAYGIELGVEYIWNKLNL